MMLAPHSARRVDAQNERDGAGLRCSVQQRLRRSSDSVAAPSQQRCAHHERSTGQSKKQPVGKICQKQGHTTTTTMTQTL